MPRVPLGNIDVLLPVAIEVGRTIDLWMNEYLHAIERQSPDVTQGELERPAACLVRHAGVWRRGDLTPAIIVYPVGLTGFSFDPDSAGEKTAILQLGIFVVAEARDEEWVTAISHRYVAAVRKILEHHPTANGLSPGGAVLYDEDYTTVSVEDEGAVRAGLTSSYEMHGVVLGRAGDGPPLGATPRPDPTAPWPVGPTVKPGGARATVTPTAHPMDPN